MFPFKFLKRKMDTISESGIISIISSEVGVPVDRNTHLINDLSADSLDVIELVLEIEDYYRITINVEGDNYGKFKTVGDLVDYILSCS